MGPKLHADFSIKEHSYSLTTIMSPFIGLPTKYYKQLGAFETLWKNQNLDSVLCDRMPLYFCKLLPRVGCCHHLSFCLK